jgi:hypothetical protein
MAGLRSELSEFRGSIAGDLAIVDIGGGLGEACQALDDRGLTIPAGTCPPVGLAGLILGADFGIRSRRNGVQSIPPSTPRGVC